METPLIVALSRQIATRDQVEVIANNIANVNTTGYKGERMVFNTFLAGTPGKDQVAFPKFVGLNRDMKAGTINATGNQLDVALRGDGFLVVRTGEGPRYTRDGHLNLNAQRELVNGRGNVVLNAADAPIVIPPNVSNITIAEDGTISAGDQQVGKLKIAKFLNQQRLERVGNGLYKTDDAPQDDPDTKVIQYSLESSNIQPIIEITNMIEAARAYQSALKVVDTQDERIRDTIQRLGKVA